MPVLYQCEYAFDISYSGTTVKTMSFLLNNMFAFFVQNLSTTFYPTLLQHIYMPRITHGILIANDLCSLLVVVFCLMLLMFNPLLLFSTRCVFRPRTSGVRGEDFT